MRCVSILSGNSLQLLAASLNTERVRYDAVDEVRGLGSATSWACPCSKASLDSIWMPNALSCAQCFDEKLPTEDKAVTDGRSLAPD